MQSRRTLVLLLAYALLVVSIDVALVLARHDGDSSDARPAAAAPAPAFPPPAGAPPVTTAPAPPSSSSSDSVAGGAARTPPAAGPSNPAATAAPAPSPIDAGCDSDLQVDDAPKAPYNFLCTADGVAITWPSNA